MGWGMYSVLGYLDFVGTNWTSPVAGGSKEPVEGQYTVQEASVQEVDEGLGSRVE